MPIDARPCPACRKAVGRHAGFCASCGRDLRAGAFTPLATHASPLVAHSTEPASAYSAELSRVGWLFGLLLASSLILGWTSRDAPGPWPGTVVTAIDALVIFMFAVWRYREMRLLLQVRMPEVDRVFEVAMIAAGLVLAMSAYFTVLQHMGVPMTKAGAVFLRTGWPSWAMYLQVSVMPAIFEELAFRGVIQQSLGTIFRERDASLIQAALFSAMHLSPIVFPSHFLMGLCFGYLRMRTKSLYPGMLLHGTWNALMLWQELR